MQYGILSLCIALCVVLVVNNVSAGPHKTVPYKFGARVKGDRLVGESSKSYEFPRITDARTRLVYPAEGVGSVVSCVEVVCKQDDQKGGAKIVAGGIGQRFITIAVEALNTKHFSYEVQFYGTD